jgi:nucleotide-binding universal stress UspA family protein
MDQWPHRGRQNRAGGRTCGINDIAVPQPGRWTDVVSGQRIVVGVHGSPGSLAALRRAVTEARARDAVLCSVLAWEPPGGEIRAAPCPPSLTRVWQDEAARRLTTAWDDAFGGAPMDLDVRLVAVRGRPGDALLHVADRSSDLLVVGAGRRGRLRRLSAGSVARYCVARGRCAVLAVPPSPLTGDYRQLLREISVLSWPAADPVQ